MNFDVGLKLKRNGIRVTYIWAAVQVIRKISFSVLESCRKQTDLGLHRGSTQTKWSHFANWTNPLQLWCRLLDGNLVTISNLESPNSRNNLHWWMFNEGAGIASEPPKVEPASRKTFRNKRREAETEERNPFQQIRRNCLIEILNYLQLWRQENVLIGLKTHIDVSYIRTMACSRQHFTFPYPHGVTHNSKLKLIPIELSDEFDQVRIFLGKRREITSHTFSWFRTSIVPENYI